MAVLDDLTGWDESTDSTATDPAPATPAPAETPQDTNQREIQSDLQTERQALNTDQRKQTWARMTGAQFAMQPMAGPKPPQFSAAPITEVPTNSTFSKLSALPDEPQAPVQPEVSQIRDTTPRLTRPGVIPLPQAPASAGDKTSAIAQAARDTGAPISQDQHAVLTADVDYRHAQRRLGGIVRSVGMTPDGASILAGAIDSGDSDTAHAAIDAHFSQLYASSEASSQTAQGQLLRDRLDGMQRQAHKAADGMLTAQSRATQANTRIVQTTPIPGVDDQPPAPTQPAAPSMESMHAAIAEAQAGKKPYQFDEKTGVSFQPAKMADGLRQAAQDGLIDPDYFKQHEQEFQSAQDKYNALEKAAGGAQGLKALLHGGGIGAAFVAGSIPGAKGGATLGALVPGAGETGISEFIGGALGGLATGSIAAWGAHKALDKLADYSDTVKSLNASAELHPVLDAAGQLVAMSANAPKAISNVYKASQLARAAAEAAGQNGTTAAAKLAAKIVGSGAAGGAAFETVVRPVFDYSKNAVLDQLGLEHDAHVQSPTLQSIITNTALGILAAGHNIEFKTYSTGQVASILTRAQIRNAAGVPLDATMTPEQMTSAAQKIGLSEQQMQGVAQPLSKGEIDVFGSLGEQLKKMKESGNFEGVDVSNVTAKQAVIPKMGDKEGTPISTTSIETNPRMLETGREELPEGAPAAEPTIKPANAREVTPSADQPGTVEPPPGVPAEPTGPAAEPQSTAAPESSAAEVAPDTQDEAMALQKQVADSTALQEQAKREGNAMAVALHGKDIADAQNRLNIIQSAPATPVAPPPGVPPETEGAATPATTPETASAKTVGESVTSNEVEPPPGVPQAQSDGEITGPALANKSADGTYEIVHHGEAGKTHADLHKEASGEAINVDTSEAEHGFRDSTGNFLTRMQAADRLLQQGVITEAQHKAVSERKEPGLTSQDFAKIKARQAETGKPASAPTNPPEPAASAEEPAQQNAKKLASAALKLHSDALKTLGHPEDFDYGPVNADSGIAVDIDSNRIRLDVPKFSKAIESMDKKKAAAWVKRAVAHEVIHIATLKYADESHANRKKLLSLIDDKELMAHAENAYGKEWRGLNDFAKAAEAARMLIEGPEELTEASYKFLGDFIKWLKEKLGKLSNDTRELIRGIEAKMGRYKKEPKAPEPSAVPTLRPGEKGTSELFQGEDAPFNLAGEAGVDWQRIADEKAKTERDSSEAKAKQDRDQLDIFGGKPDAAPSSHDKSKSNSISKPRVGEAAGTIQSAERGGAPSGGQQNRPRSGRVEATAKSYYQGLPAKVNIDRSDPTRTVDIDLRTGEITVNPDAMARVADHLDSLAKGEGEKWTEAALHEELAHWLDMRVSGIRGVDAFSRQRAAWMAAPQDVREALSRAYTVDTDDRGRGAEIIRMLFQIIHTGEITEAHRPDRNSQDITDALSKWNLPQWLSEHLESMVNGMVRMNSLRDNYQEPNPERNSGELGAANPSDIYRHIYDKAVTEIEAAKDEMKLRGTKEKVTYKTDAVTNRANYYGQQAGNSIKLDLPEKKDRDAMPFVIEAAGDPAKLQQFKADIAASSDPKLAKKFEPIIDHAIADQARLTAAVKNHEKLMQQNVAELKTNGLEVGEVENYVTRKLDAPDAVKEALPNPMFSTGSGQGNSPRYFTKGRSFETLADAIKAGYPPISTDLADLDAHRIEAAKRMIFQKQMFDELRATPSPTNGEPIIGAMQQRKLANGETEQTVPRGYSIVQAGGTPLVVHNDFANVFRDLFGGSALRQTTVGRVAIKTAAILKHGTLAIDTFHIGRMLLKMAAAGGGGPVTTRGQRLAWNLHKGRALLEYSDADLGRAVSMGDITQQEADYAKGNRAKVEKLMEHGMNVGRVADNLMEQAKLHLPILSTLNDWIFGKLSRSAMLQSSLVNLERNLKNPSLSTEDAYRQTAREMNEIFGNLQNQGILRNKTLQDISRMIFLAPNWTESQFRNEGRAYAQAGKAAYNAARGRGFRVGNSARIFAAGFVGLLVANQIINFLSRGQTTFQNPEDGHRLDAWIPGGKRGFWFDPLEIAGEYAHAAEKYTAQHENPVDVAAHIVSNKLSPLARGLKEGITGRDYAGRHFLTNADRLRATITDMVPIPLVSGAFFEKDPRAPLGYRVTRQPGSFEKQLLQSVGAKLTPAQSPRTQMFALAQPFRADRGQTDAAGEYTELRRAIDNDQLDNARSEIEWLQERGKSMDAITHAMGIRKGGQIAPELFTGSQDREKELIASLTEKEQGIYQQAQVDHLNNALKFLKLIKDMAPMGPQPKPALTAAKKSTFSKL